jgi:hypothetical protein
MRITGDRRGWVVIAEWHGEDRVVFGPDSVWACLEFRFNNQ